MVYVLDGEVEVTIAGKPVNLKKGEMTIMPAKQPALSAKTRFKMLLNDKVLTEHLSPNVEVTVVAKRAWGGTGGFSAG